MPSPESSTLTRTSFADGLDQHGDRAVGGRVAERVREQVEENALDLVRRAPHRRRPVETSLETDVPPACLGLEAAHARIDEAGERRLVELERQHAGVDAGELEEVVDE